MYLYNLNILLLKSIYLKLYYFLIVSKITWLTIIFSKLGVQFSSVQFSCSIMSNSFQPHESQHARPPCPSPNPGVYSNSCPSSRWCHPAISSSVIPSSSCPQSFPASGSFPISRLFASCDQSIEALASASVVPMNIQGWFSLGLTGLIFLQSKDSQESSPTPQFKSISSSVLNFLYGSILTSVHDQLSLWSSSHICTWLLEKP